MTAFNKNILESLAVGDALGMPTEFMSREKIKKEYGIVDHLIDPKYSLIHKDLKYSQITDDTEQNLYLIETYCTDRKITIQNTVSSLIKWMEQTKAVEHGYIGPSSSRALKRIKEGESPEIAGMGGTTCGAPMRVIAPVLCLYDQSEEGLKKAIFNCTVPTHNTNLAMEAAMCIGFAIKAAIDGYSYDEIIHRAYEGAVTGRASSDYDYVGASCKNKAEILVEQIKKAKSEDEVLDIIYYLNGTTMEANDISSAVLGIFSFAKDDVWKSIKLGASVGGDTDTIAAIAGALSCSYAKKHNIPDEILKAVVSNNNLDLNRYSDLIINRFGEV
jgi:ADP-ribosylglycohydrolase